MSPEVLLRVVAPALPSLRAGCSSFLLVQHLLQVELTGTNFAQEDMESLSLGFFFFKMRLQRFLLGNASNSHVAQCASEICASSW